MRRRALSVRVVAVLCALALGAAVAVGVAQAPAYSQDQKPPETFLRKGTERLQQGRLGTYCWAYECLDAVPSYPRAVPVREDSKLHIRVWKRERPEQFALHAYRRVGEDGFPAGKAQRIPYSTRLVLRDGKTVARDFIFTVSEPDRHYYLSAFGYWTDARGNPVGDATWDFHFRTN